MRATKKITVEYTVILSKRELEDIHYALGTQISNEKDFAANRFVTLRDQFDAAIDAFSGETIGDR